MTRQNKPSSPSMITNWWIWSVRNQSWLAGQVRIYIYGATAVVAFFALAGVIELRTAILSIFIAGVIIMGIIWTLLQQRKAWLLNIKEPELRQKALTAMIDYLNEVKGVGPSPQSGHGVQTDNPDHCVECKT